MNSYPRHVGDWIRDTVGLSMLEEAAYSRLVDQYYAREGPLPLDRDMLCRLARCTSAAERNAVDYVLQTYFVKEDDGWHQKRCDEELAKYRAKSALAAESANRRWSERNANAMRTHSERNAEAMRRQCEGNASQYPISNNQEPRIKDNTPIAGSVGMERESGPLPRTTDARGARLPKDWTLPDDWRRWAEGERPPKDIDRIADAFRDYWVGRAGAGGRKVDWEATWRNWVRREAEQGKPVRGPPDSPISASHRPAKLGPDVPIAPMPDDIRGLLAEFKRRHIT